MKKTLGKILLDLIPVAIGVYIGLFVSNWNQDKQNKKLTTDALERIQREILLNQKNIDSVKDYHIMVRDTVDKIDITTLENSASTFYFWRGFNMPKLQSSAFETAFQAGITPYIEADLLEQLNSLYSYQDSYNDFSKTAGQGLYSIDFSNDNASRRMLIFIRMMMSDIFYFEQDLQKEFKTSLEMLNQ